MDKQQQNASIDNILSDVEKLLERANRKEYIPTNHERIQFERIRIIITNMADWF